MDGENIWCKKENVSFDVSMGAYDACEASDLIGLYMLNLVVNEHKILQREYFGLYRDDILGVVKGSGPQIESIKKKIIQIFKQEGLKVTAEANTKTAQYLDFTLNLDKKIHMPFHKQNANIVYVNKKSNHPPLVLNNIPKGIENRLSRLSSNETCFNNEKHIFQKALDDAGYSHQLKMQTTPHMSIKQISHIIPPDDVILTGGATRSDMSQEQYDINNSHVSANNNTQHLIKKGKRNKIVVV